MADFKNWATRWYSAHPGGTQSEMLRDYNNTVEAMYGYKHGIVAGGYTGDNSYISSQDVRDFNQRNRDLYGSANSEGGVHGYDEDLDMYNGSTTAQRFIDRTDEDVTDFDWGLTGEDENFDALFNGLAKDRWGHYYVNSAESEPDEAEPVEQTDDNGTHTNFNPGGNGSYTTGTGEAGEEEEGFSMPDLSGMIPDALRAGNLARTLAYNRRLKKQRLPFILQNPYERHLQVTGDLGAIMRNNENAAALMHNASRATTSDAANYFANQLDAFINAHGYTEQGNLTNDEAIAKTRDAANTQEANNQLQRVNSARQNQNNILQYNTSKITNDKAYDKSITESLNNFNTDLITRLEQKQQTNRTRADAYMEQSISNEIASDLNAAGISATPEEQQLFDDIFSGDRTTSDLTADEKTAFNRMLNDYQETVRQRTASYYGVPYTPYRRSSAAGSGWSPEVSMTGSYATEKEARGGTLGQSSEKVEVQKLRSKVSQMTEYQKHLNKRIDKMEKDLDRMERSANKYIQGMKNKVS